MPSDSARKVVKPNETGNGTGVPAVTPLVAGCTEHPIMPRLVLAGRTVARPAHTVDDSAGRRTDVPGKSKA